MLHSWGETPSQSDRCWPPIPTWVSGDLIHATSLQPRPKGPGPQPGGRTFPVAAEQAGPQATTSTSSTYGIWSIGTMKAVL